ncbi:MAG: hypothetical protein KDA52_19715 [Planctomycetaceae bacterium]|nr:hypothetical protein [Planctomycetaceae bacterium]
MSRNRRKLGTALKTKVALSIEGIVPRHRTTTPHPGHKKSPYLLRSLDTFRPDQVWCSDITCIPLRHGFLYLKAVMDWFSRDVLSCTLEKTFCREALEEPHTNRLGGRASPSVRRGLSRCGVRDQRRSYPSASLQQHREDYPTRFS